MDNRENELCLPNAPLGLCFKSKEFTEDTFSVDQFVSKHRKQVSLEQLRDDLSIYLRVLHSAMVKLINKDYADFVNLSTNLVGLDKSLENISQPLVKLKTQFTDVQKSLQDEMSKLNHHLKEARILARKKHLCQSVTALVGHLEKMEALIQTNRGEVDWSPELIERITLHLGQVYFLRPQVQHFQLVKNLWPRIQFVSEKFEGRLQTLLLREVSGDLASLKRVLRIYGTLGKGPEAERLLRTHLVKPYIAKVITPKVFQEDGIQAMYDRVLHFFPHSCPKLLELLHSHQPRVQGDCDLPLDPVGGALWPEVELGLAGLQMALLAPGNAERFHLHYVATSAFLDRLLQLCPYPDSLLSQESFVAFVERWNLSVYFQLRFQEIAGGFETCLAGSPLSRAEEGSMFHLTATQSLWSSLESCWQSSVWLEELTPDFWQLTLQILARHSAWLQSTLQGSKHHPDPTQMVLLLADLTNLHTQVPYLFENVIQPKLRELNCANIKTFKDGLDSWVESSVDLPQQLGEIASKQVASQCASAFRQVADLPRLYRKTNREIPTKPSAYVETVLSPLEAFLHTCGTLVEPQWRDQWCRAVLADLTSQFHTATADVLTSVKKMEDSLKRLKKEARASRPSAGMSDDDKIRLQLALDVEHFRTKVQQLELAGGDSSIPGLSELISMVNSSRPSLT